MLGCNSSHHENKEEREVGNVCLSSYEDVGVRGTVKDTLYIFHLLFSYPPLLLPSSLLHSYSSLPCILSRPQEAQEVPVSPLLQLRDTQTTADLNLSFHGKTPVKSTSKVPSPIPTAHTHIYTHSRHCGSKLEHCINYKLRMNMALTSQTSMRMCCFNLFFSLNTVSAFL